MFPTFISILDIQSWWEVPSIAHFCSLFRTAFNLLDFDIEDLEEALLTDGTEETSWLQELIVRLLSGCLANNDVSTSNYQMFLRRLFRQKCQEHDRYNPFNTDIDFQLLPLRTKVDILHALCDFRLDADDVLEQLKNLEADSLRVEPLGYDSNDSSYWYFYGTRLYREDFHTKNNKKKSVWQVICFTEDDWFQLNKKLKKSSNKSERQLHRTLSENFLPELPRLFREKERLARKRLLENLPRRTSKRLRKDITLPEKVDSPPIKRAYLQEKHKREFEKRRKEAYERRAKLKEQQSEEDSDKSECSNEMAGAKIKPKKSKVRQRKTSSSSTNSKDTASSRSTTRQKSNEHKKSSTSTSAATSVGRQTNNSLSAATGPVVIQPVSNLHKKKLKTSQVFRQTDEDLLTGMHKILDYVKNHEDAWPFADPVDEEYAPNYYSVIRKPMDLQKMEEKLDEGMYKNFAKFRDDFQLIVDNCRLYNGVENEYTEMVDNLLKVFERGTEKFLDQISSSDDEIAVEYPKTDVESKDLKKKPEIKSLKRKPTLAANTDKKRERSLSEESLSKQSNDSFEHKKVERPTKKLCKTKKETEIKKDVKHKKNTKMSKKDRSRSRSLTKSPLLWCYSSSPPPSSEPPSPLENRRFDFSPPKKQKKSLETKCDDNVSKGKQKLEKFKNLFNDNDENKLIKKDVLVQKPKDKHNKLRETIEKLKAKSEISTKLSESEFFDMDSPKENKEKKKDDKIKLKTNKKNESENKKPKKNAKNSAKNAEIEALTIATEQTLKDINKWLDGTPKFNEFSSASNSPSYGVFDDVTDVGNNNKNEEIRKKLDNKLPHRKDVKDIKRRTFNRDPVKLLKRREIQRTIDRLQPGKSKGNLLSNVQNINNNNNNTNKADELFLQCLTKMKDTKNSLIVKTDDNAPKLSLGTVLDSFGRHKFIDENKKEIEKTNDEQEFQNKITDEVKEEIKQLNNNKKSPIQQEESSMMSGATPNLSAWFKAFGAPKIQSATQKKSEKTEKEEKTELKKDEKIPVPETSPATPETPVHGQPMPRQRKLSTGSSVSERSSFSQDMDSPRVGIDERLGGSYPAPYPSPLHRSPSGASPIMASPRPDVSPKSAYPPFNGQIRVGFYQDTVSTKSSPDKSCSPRDNPQSPYNSQNEHLYTPNTNAQSYSYANSPYYTHNPNYSNTTTTYTDNSSYYDTNKSLTDQYQAKIPQQSYNTQNSPINSNNNNPSPASHPNSPNMVETNYRDDKMIDNGKMNQSAIFPVKKRAYNEPEQLNRYEIERNDDYNNRNLQVLDNANQVNRIEEQKYLHQNLPEPPKLTNLDYNKQQQQQQQQQQELNLRNYSTNPYYNNENYPLNIPRTGQKLDMTKYTNMGYTGADVNFSRNIQQYSRPELNYPRSSHQSVSVPQNQLFSQTEPMRYSNPNLQMSAYNTNNPQQAHLNYSQTNTTRPNDSSTVTIPRPTYNHLEMDQAIGLRGNIANLTHIVDRYNNDERIMTGLQPPTTTTTPVSQYYNDKTMMFNKPVTSGSGLPPIFNHQSPNMTYNQNIQTSSTSSMYNRQLTELQSPVMTGEKSLPLQQQTVAPVPEKKTKKRKSSKNAQAAVALEAQPSSQQGFQSYAGLKTSQQTNAPTSQPSSAMEPSAISLKTASVVPGSAFNFGPTPPGLGISTGLYGDKDAYHPNFLDDFRSAAPNYYMAAAAAAAQHHQQRSTPDPSAADKQTRTVSAHQASSTTTATGAPQPYPFIGAPHQARPPPSYPLGAPFMPSAAQAQLMDAGSPLYQHYLQAGVLNQGLLGPPPGHYPPGYHPALSMRQPYDSMTRPSWL